MGSVDNFDKIKSDKTKKIEDSVPWGSSDEYLKDRLKYFDEDEKRINYLVRDNTLEKREGLTLRWLLLTQVDELMENLNQAIESYYIIQTKYLRESDEEFFELLHRKIEHYRRILDSLKKEVKSGFPLNESWYRFYEIRLVSRQHLSVVKYKAY